MDADIMFKGEMLEMLRPASEIKINQIFTKSPNKANDMDPLPIRPWKKSMYQLPLKAPIINKSMALDEEFLIGLIMLDI